MAKKGLKLFRSFSLRGIFTGLNLTLLVFIFSLLLFIFINLQRQQRIIRSLLILNDLTTELNRLEKVQLEVFRRPDLELKDNQVLRIKKQLNVIRNLIERLNELKVFHQNDVLQHLITDLDEYETNFFRVVDLNYRLYNESEGRAPLFESMVNQLMYSTIYNDEPFKSIRDSVAEYIRELQAKRLSIGKFSERMRRIIENLRRYKFMVESQTIIQEQMLIHLRNMMNVISEYYTLLDEYGEPFSSGYFAKMQYSLNSAHVDVENIRAILQQLIHKRYIRLNWAVGVFVILVVILGIVAATTFYRDLFKAINAVRVYFDDLIAGVIKYMPIIQSPTEIFFLSTRMNKHINNLLQKKKVIDELSKGNFDVEIKLLSRDDQLGISLTKLKEYLIKNREEALKTMEAETKQKWITEGLAKLGETMRDNLDDLDKLFKATLKVLLEYLDAPMGAFYFRKELENGEVEYQLKISYAYNKQRTPQLSYKLTEGFVGTVAAEKKPMIIEKVPDNYLFYETAFGYGRPSTIAFYPVISEDKVLGILEIADNQKFEEHKLQLLEKFTDDFAVTITFVLINEQTKQLVRQLRQQASEFIDKEKNYREQIANYKKQVEELKKELENLKTQLRTKDTIINEKVAEIVKLKDQIVKKEEQLKETIENFEKVERKLKDRISYLEKQLEAVVEELEKLQKQLKNKNENE